MSCVLTYYYYKTGIMVMSLSNRSLSDRLELTLDEKEIVCSLDLKKYPELYEEQKQLAAELRDLYTLGSPDVAPDIVKAIKYKKLAAGIKDEEQSILGKVRSLFTNPTNGLYATLRFINLLRQLVARANKFTPNISKGFLPNEFSYLGLVYGVTLLLDIGVVIYCTFYNYILCSKSSLPATGPESKKIYVEYLNEELHYTVLNKVGEPVNGIISKEEFDEIVGDEKTKSQIVKDLGQDNLTSLQPFLPKLLDKTAKKGHTYFSTSGSWQRFKNVLLEDDRIFNILNDGPWFAVNLAAIILTGGLSLILNMAGLAYDVIVETIKSVIACNKHDTLAKKIAAFIATEKAEIDYLEQEKSSFENRISGLNEITNTELENSEDTFEIQKHERQEIAQRKGQNSDKARDLVAKNWEINTKYEPLGVETKNKADAIFYSNIIKMVGVICLGGGMGFLLFPPAAVATATAITIGIPVAITLVVVGSLLTGLGKMIYDAGSYIVGAISEKINGQPNQPQNKNTPAPENNNTDARVKEVLLENVDSKAPLDIPPIKIVEIANESPSVTQRISNFFGCLFSAPCCSVSDNQKDESNVLLNNQSSTPT